MTMANVQGQGQAWRERAELAERENTRLHAEMEELRARVPQGMSRAQSEPLRDLTPAEMLRLAADMFEARQFAQAKPIVDHVSAELAAWANAVRSDS